MADLLKLTWASDNEADQDTFNLLDFAQGFTASDDTWIPAVMADGQITCTETMTFYASGLSHDQMAGYIQKLDDWKRKIAWSHEQAQRGIVWLNARWKSETNTRRAMVWKLDYSLGDSPYGPFLRDSNFMSSFVVTIIRGAWEALEETLLTFSPTTFNANGGKSSPTTIVSGDIPARIMLGTFTTGSTPTDLVTSQFWLGMRTSRLGDPSVFQSNWELEVSDWLKNIAHGEASDDTVITADATASGGNKIVINFAGGASLLQRARTTVDNVTALPDSYEQRGDYVCLMRAKMSGAGIARARVSSGFFDNDFSNTYIVNPRVTIQGTSWLLYNMGVVRIPAAKVNYDDVFYPVLAGVNSILFSGVGLDAERVSGASNLEVDEYIMIPYNDCYAFFDMSTNDSIAIIRTNANESIIAFGHTGNQAELELKNWSYPIDDEPVYLVGAFQSTTTHDMAETLFPGIWYIPRWRTLRGTE